MTTNEARRNRGCVKRAATEGCHLEAMIDRRRVLRYSVAAGERARVLRKQMTIGEAVLWRCLKGKSIKGYDFHRQKPIGDHIVDFFCARLMLVVEVDGESHLGREEEDASRQRILESMGLSFLRFDDEEIRRDARGAVRVIERWIEEQEAGEGVS